MKNIFLLWHSPFSKTIIFTDSVHDYEILEKSLEKLSSKVTGKLLWNTDCSKFEFKYTNLEIFIGKW